MDKKRIIRRLLSLFVSVAMVLVYIPQIAFADDGNEDDEIFKLFSIRDWEAQYNEQFVYYGGQVCILWDGKDKYYPKETELQQPEEGVDEDGEYYYQSGICSTLIPNDAEYIEIIMVPDDNFEPKLRIVDASSNGEFVEGIEYDEDYGGYVYKYEITDENTGISNAEQTGGVDFYPEFLYEEEDDWIQPQDGTILDLGNISPTYDENEYEYYYYENDGTIYLTKGGSMEIFFDNRKYNPNKTHEYNYVYDEQDDPIECNCQTRIPVGTKKVQIRLHPKDKHYIPKVKLFDATKNGEYDDSVEYNESLGCYVYEYELNEKNLGGNEENPYGKVGFSCEFNFQPTTTLFGICGLVDSDIQDKIKVKRGKMELYWNGDIKYTVSDNDFWKKYYYEYDGSTILDGEEHLMELPKNTTSIVMRVYPKQGYIPAFRVFDASTQSEEGKVLTGEYNEKDGYYELVYKITDDCIYNNDGSLNGYIRISPEYNFDSSFADDLSGMVYFDNSQVKWEKVYAWAWNEADELWALNHGFEEWPGIELYYDQNTGYYFWQCEDLSGANVMFNNFGRGLQTNNDAASGALAGYVCKPTSIDDKGKYNAVWEKVKTETAHTHTVVIDKAVAATCEEKGKTEGSHCSECGEIIKKQEVIPATGHTVVTDKAVAATCEKDGLTEGSHCSVCGKVIKKQEVVPATGHTVVTDKAVAATCEKSGLTEGSHCSVCGKVIKKQEVIPATGHTVVTDKAVAATCEKSGKTEGSHCSACGKVIKKQTVIPATGHTVVTDKAVAATCEKSGLTEGSHCSVCGKVIKKQNKVAATGHKYTKTTVKAKPGSNGSVYQKCSKCGHKEVLSTIYAPKTVACTKTSYVYNGKAIKPIITVKDTKGKVIGSSHYTIEYSKNINVGTGSVKVVFKGNNYSGSLSTTFTITKANNSLSGKTSYNKTADSKKQTFVLDMKAKGGSITYKSNNKNVSVDKKGKVTIQKNFSGIVTITVTAGNNNYKTITKDITLTIKPGVTSIKTLRNTSDNGARRGKVTVTWNKLSYVSGYQVQYSNVSSYIGAGSTYNISNVSTLSKEISNLIKGRTYYVRVRTYHKVGKKTLYGPWSDTKSIRIS